MTTLYDINENINNLLLEAQEFTEETSVEIVDEWNARFMEEKGDLGEKLEGIMIVRQNAIANSNALGSEVSRLTGKMAAESKVAQRMQDLLSGFMKMNGDKEIKTNLFHAKFKKNPPAMKLSELLETTLRSDSGLESAEGKVKEAKVKYKEEKDKIKKSLKEGEDVLGAELTQGERLDIK